MRRWSSLFGILASVLVVAVSGLLAVFGQTQQPQNAPAALAKCQQCHGETVQMSHLSLTSRDATLKGGDHGAALIPGNAEDSLIYKRITGQIKPAMPMAPLPGLTNEEIVAFRDWINAGAPET